MTSTPAPIDWRDRMAAKTLRREGADALRNFGYTPEQIERAQAVLDAEDAAR